MGHGCSVGSHMFNLCRKFICLDKNSLLVPQPSDYSQNGPSVRVEGKKSSCISILQWNCYHLNDGKLEELSSLIQVKKPAVVCLSELAAVNKSMIPRKISGYHKPLVARPEGSKGIAIMIRNDIVFQDYRVVNANEKKAYGQYVDISIEADSIRLCHVYVNPATIKSDRKIFWSEVGSLVSQKKFGVVVGDINENSKVFGECNRNNNSSLDQVMQELNWNVLNDGSHTRMCLTQEEVQVSALDVTITSESMTQFASRWSVLGHMGSDHLPVWSEFQFSPSRKFVRPPETTRDWNGIRKFMAARIMDTPELSTTTVIEVLEEALTKFPPKKTKHKQSPWWDDELADLKRRRNRAFNDGETEVYLLMRKRFRSRLKSRQKAFRTSKIKEIGEASNPWKIFKWLFPEFRKKKQPFVSPVGPNTLAMTLADQFEKLSTPDESSPSDVFNAAGLSIRSVPSSLDISERDLVSVLKSSNMKSACGHDGVGYATIQRVCENRTIRRAVTQTMSIWFAQGYPAAMKCAKVIPVAKGKSHKDGYRPISLLPCLSKLSEKVLTVKLRRLIERQLPGNQAGCRAQMSTVDCALRMFQASSMAAQEDQEFGCVLLDFSKAYDRVPHERVLMKLSKFRDMTRELVIAVAHWLTDRTFYYDVDGCQSSKRKIRRDFPRDHHCRCSCGSSLSQTFPS